jgi:hypothetical protein
MTPQQFVVKWKPIALAERAAAQSHFLGLCAPCPGTMRTARHRPMTPRTAN